jgi:hypothetical protein
MLLSIIEYVLVVFFNIGYVVSHVSRDLAINSYAFDEYLFNLILQPIEVARFQSLLHEPGDIGTFNGILIFGLLNLNGYKFEKIMIVLSGLISMSMAFYILAVIYILLNFSKLKFKTLILSVLVLVGVYFVFEEQIEKQIVYRITENKVDNRSDDRMIAANLKNLGNCQLLGAGYGSVNKKYGSGSAGANVFIYDYGWIGFFIIFLCYTATFYNFCNKKLSVNQFIFLIAFWLSFYQRQNIYEIQIVMAFLLPSMINYINSLNNKNRNENNSFYR